MAQLLLGVALGTSVHSWPRRPGPVRLRTKSGLQGGEVGWGGGLSKGGVK